jgi:tetratricopeptide (TPR) repeat protein
MNGEALKNATVGALVATTLAAGVVMSLPLGGREPAPAPGPAARARTAADAGAPASLADLDALIADRERWLAGRPGDELAWAELGAAYTERSERRARWSEFPRAERALRKSLELLPAEEGNTEALLGLAALANARHDHLTARGLAQRAEKQRPRRWTVYPVLIDAYGGLGDQVSAGRALERLQRLYDGSRARAVSARIYRDRGWREDAAATAHDAAGAADGPVERAAALWRLGELSWERGEPRAALEAADRALRLDGELAGARVTRARALAALGRADEALREYQSALAVRPLPAYALEAGELYESRGLRGDSVSRYELMRTSARSAAAHGGDEDLVLARYEADHGDPAEAVRLLRADWERGVRAPELADALGWALYRDGRPAEGLPYLRRAMSDGPRNALVAYHLGQTERVLGLYGPARRHLGQALRINPHFSPLLAPRARAALDSLGLPPGGGPRKITGKEDLTPKKAVRPRVPQGTGSGTGTGSRAGTASGRRTTAGTGTGTGSRTGTGAAKVAAGGAAGQGR